MPYNVQTKHKHHNEFIGNVFLLWLFIIALRSEPVCDALHWH